MTDQSASRPLAAGEPVLLVDPKGHSYLVRLREKGRLDTNLGVIYHSYLIGLTDGGTVASATGALFRAYRPTLVDFILKMPRRTQIIYPKDLAMVLLWADVYPGATVLEAGMGSGALTMALLRAVGPLGRVIAYESRPEFSQVALSNIAAFHGEAPNLLVKEANVYEGIEEGELDRIILDVPEPWHTVPHAAKALRSGGILLIYLPTVLQVHQAVAALRREPRFGLIETLEVLLRPWEVGSLSVRPAHRMVAHTGFITVARKHTPVGSSGTPEGTL